MGFDSFVLKYGKAKIIAVGDIVVLSLLEKGIRPFASVFDFRSMRTEISEEQKKRLMLEYPSPACVSNPPGTITEGLEKASKSLANKGGALLVEGEEDLASLVLAADSKLGAVLVYGQPNEGVVAIECGQNIRKKASAILGKIKIGKERGFTPNLCQGNEGARKPSMR